MRKKNAWFRAMTAWLVTACLMWAMVPTEAVAEVLAAASEFAIMEVGANDTEARAQSKMDQAGSDEADDAQPVDSVVLSAQDDATEEVTDTLTHDTTGAKDQNYIDWNYGSDKTVSGAAYAGNTAGEHGSIQMRSSKNNSGIVTTGSGGKVRSVVVEWNSNTANGRTLNIYGSNEQFESAEDLYSEETWGTPLGTIVYGTTTALTIVGNYAYIGIRSNSGALYLNSLSIAWAKSGSTAPAYAVNVNPSEHGSVATSHTAAKAGDRVALTANPEFGYMLDQVVVTDASGVEIAVNNNAFIMPDTEVTVDATFVRLPPVTYIDEHGELQDTGETPYGFITNDKVSASGGATLTGGWWVVQENVKASPRLVISGDVHLILADGIKLEANQGIQVTGNDSLTIYGQTSGSGKLVAKGKSYAAGIGGSSDESGGIITINGGTIETEGGQGSGISASFGGAGIGSGSVDAHKPATNGGVITINGGTVTTKGGPCAAGIGGGTQSAGGTIAINGGAVKATGAGDLNSPDQDGGAGIGGGYSADGGTVRITGGQITAQAVNDAAGIGPGSHYWVDGAEGQVFGGAVTLSLSRSADFVLANTYKNDHGVRPSISVTYPDGSDASVRDSEDTTKKYRGALTSEEVDAVAGKTLVADLPVCERASLTLSGTIGVNYLMDLSSLKTEDLRSTYMEFKVGSGAKQVQHTAHFDPTQTSKDGTCYSFTCPTTSVQMAETIEATIHFTLAGKNQVLALENYSVKTYVEAFDEYQATHSSDGQAYDDKMVALVHSIADYGHHAQPYLAAANKWAIGVDYSEMSKCYTAEYNGNDIASILGSYAAAKNLQGTNIKSASTRLRLDSGTSLEALLAPVDNHAFTEEDRQAITATFDGKAQEVSLEADGRISVRVDGISAHLLGTPLVIKCGEKQVLTLTALSYAKITLDDSSTSQIGKNAMCAFYKYFEATDSIKKGQ